MMLQIALSAPAGGSTDKAVILALLVSIALAGAVFLHSRPRLAFASWLCVMCFVPAWIGVTVSFYFMAITVYCVYVLILLIPIHSICAGLADLAVLIFFLVSFVPILAGGANGAATFTTVTQWILPFLVGRLVPIKAGIHWVATCFSTVMAVVGALAIVEFIFHWNPFVGIRASNIIYKTYSSLQERGGIVRAEGAFGHAIALGCCLALAIPFVLAASYRLSIRVAMIGVMLGATVVTVSRIGMICAVSSLVISVFFLRDGLTRRARLGAVAILAAIAASSIPLVSSVFTTAGSEATNSADYRGDLLSLVPDMSIVGFSANGVKSPNGSLYFGRFHSIDSTLILTGLTYGLLLLTLAVVLLLVATGLVLTRRATPATIAVVAQIPALATVALITQYGSFLWFVIGVAVFSQVNRPWETSSPGRNLEVSSVKTATIIPARP